MEVKTWNSHLMYQEKEFLDLLVKYGPSRSKLEVVDINGYYGLCYSIPFFNYARLEADLFESTDVDKFLPAAIDFAKEKGIARIEITTTWENKNSLLKKYPFRRFPATRVIDCTNDIDEIWKSLRGSTRRQIKQAIKRGVSVDETKDVKDFDEWFRIYKDLARRRDFKTAPYEFLYELFKTQKFAKLFVARLHDEIIGGLFFLVHRNMRFMNGASYKKFYNYRPNNLLHWKAICWAHENGIHYYDFGGVLPEDDPARKTGGLIRGHFKEGFNGEYKEYYIYEIMLNPFKDRIIKLLADVYRLKDKMFKDKLDPQLKKLSYLQ